MENLDFIMAFENGEIESEDEIIDGFQKLLDTGILFHLQGFYHRIGNQLLEQGLITFQEKVTV